jgi:hypothetical protein
VNPAQPDQLDVRNHIIGAFNEAAAAGWRRRAAEFDRAAPRRSDHHGNATPPQLSAAWNRCKASAAACRAAADLIDRYGISPDILDELDATLQQLQPAPRRAA